jgi:IS1 family transposase
MCSDAQDRTFGTLRSQPDKILLVTKMLTEGVGIRGAARIAGCHRDTVLRILRHAGTRSYDLLKRKLQDVKPGRIEADETWTFVLKKANKEIDPELDMNPWGDFYVFLAVEADTKVLFMPTIGKRTELATERFTDDLSRSTTGRFQLTTDGFKPYKKAVKNTFGKRVDFAQFYKEVNMENERLPVKKNPFRVRSGNPNLFLATTAHMERGNLTLRTWNKRFNRKTICFSKDEEYLAYSVYLFAASYNFCHLHSAHKKKLLKRNRRNISLQP